MPKITLAAFWERHPSLFTPAVIRSRDHLREFSAAGLRLLDAQACLLDSRPASAFNPNPTGYRFLDDKMVEIATTTNRQIMEAWVQVWEEELHTAKVNLDTNLAELQHTVNSVLESAFGDNLALVPTEAIFEKVLAAATNEKAALPRKKLPSSVHCLDCSISLSLDSFLSLGLKFVPRLHPFSRRDWRDSLCRFTRGIFLYGYFGGSSRDPPDLLRLYAPSFWTPDIHEAPPSFVDFTDRLRSYCWELSPAPVGPNLPPELSTALRELRDLDLVVCPADKGATVVVLPATRYRNLCLEHLSTPAYETVTDILPVNCLLRKAAASIWDSFPLRVQRRLEAPGTRFPNFYGLPKIHKTPVAIRPIVSSIDSDTYWWAV